MTVADVCGPDTVLSTGPTVPIISSVFAVVPFLAEVPRLPVLSLDDAWFAVSTDGSGRVLFGSAAAESVTPSVVWSGAEGKGTLDGEGERFGVLGRVEAGRNTTGFSLSSSILKNRPAGLQDTERECE